MNRYWKLITVDCILGPVLVWCVMVGAMLLIGYVPQ